VWHDSIICVTWLNHVCDMTHSYVWHDSIICVTWLTLACDVTQSYVWHDSIICVTWLTHMCDMTHSYVWRVFCVFTRVSLLTCMCVTWLNHMCDMTHSYVWPNSCTCVTWLTLICEIACAFFSLVLCWVCICVKWLMQHCGLMHTWDVTCSYMRSSLCLFQLRSLLRLYMCDITHATLWPDSCTCVTWLTLMCELTCFVSFSLVSVEVIYVRHDSCNTVTRLMHTCDETHFYIWPDFCYVQFGVTDLLIQGGADP